MFVCVDLGCVELISFLDLFYIPRGVPVLIAVLHNKHDIIISLFAVLNSIVTLNSIINTKLHYLLNSIVAEQHFRLNSIIVT